MKKRASLLEKVLLILEIIGSSDKPVDINYLMNLSGIPLSSLYKLMDNLASIGFITKNPGTKTFLLGFKLLYLGNRARFQLPLVAVVKPYLEDLTQLTGETSNLVVEDHGEAVYIERVDSIHPLRITHMIGRKAPLHATGVGKCFLAWRPPQEVVRIINKTGMNKLTLYTISNLNDLLNELKKIKEKGFALDEEECEVGIRCIAAPIFIGDQVIAAISISGPVIRITEEKIDNYSEQLCRVTKEITSILNGDSTGRDEY
jgi:IclR family KDG regulon transcriptional repressor